MRVPLLVLLSRGLQNSLLGPAVNATLPHEAEHHAGRSVLPAAGGGAAGAGAFLQKAHDALAADAALQEEATWRQVLAQHAGWCGVVGCLCGAATGGAVWLALRLWWQHSAKEEGEEVAVGPMMTRDASAQFEGGSPRNIDEVEKRRSFLNKELDRLKEKEQQFQGSSPGAVPTLKDYDSLLRTMVQEAVQRFMPTLSRGQAIRSIAENRASQFALKARAFVINELNGAAGDLCEALDAPEAMLLLDLNSAAAAHFPPVAVLLAGLLTPFLLQIMLYMHITQLVLVLAPFGALVTWAMTVDRNAPCQAIPGIHVWIWVQLVLVYLLVWARVMMVLQIRKGQWQLNSKAAEIREAHFQRRSEKEGGAMQGLLDLRELFVSQAALVQQVLLLEDRVRSGTARHIVGFATLLWLIVMVWTFFLVVCYALVPGGVEFYSPYYASPENYCGAWATVLTARIACLVAVLVFGTNFATVCHWLSDVVVHSDAFSSFIMRYAQHFDESLLGLPVAQLLTKAFLLRDSSDMTFTKLAVAVHEKTTAAKELKETEARLEELRKKLAEKEAHVESLQRDTDRLHEAWAPTSSPRGSDSEGAAPRSDAGGTRGPGAPRGERLDLPEAVNVETWMQMWRQRGKEAIDAAHQRAVQVEQVTTEDFDRVVRRIVDGTEQLRQSVDNVRDASSDPNVPWSQVIDAIGDEFTRRRSRATSDTASGSRTETPGAHFEAFQSAINESTPALQNVLAQVVETSERVSQQVQERLRVYAPEAVERGQEVMERLREYSPEAMERGQQLMETIRSEGLRLPMARRHLLRVRTSLLPGMPAQEAAAAAAAAAAEEASSGSEYGSLAEASPAEPADSAVTGGSSASLGETAERFGSATSLGEAPTRGRSRVPTTGSAAYGTPMGQVGSPTHSAAVAAALASAVEARAQRGSASRNTSPPPERTGSQ